MGNNDQNNYDDEPYYITLTLDDGTELECMVVGFFEALDRDYIALLPEENDKTDEGEVFLYRYSETEDEDPVLDTIETDDEYEEVSKAFTAFLDSIEADELIDEDDFLADN